MSLEQAITDHASALRELAAAIRSTVGTTHELTAATDKVIADAKKPTAATASSPSGAKPQTTAQPENAPGKPAPEAETKPAALTYEDVKAKVLALSKEKGREPTVALLQKHGVSKAPDLKPEQFAQFITDVNAIMAGAYDPLASGELA